MQDAELFEQYRKVLNQLMHHMKEANCTHSVPELLDEFDFEDDN